MRVRGLAVLLAVLGLSGLASAHFALLEPASALLIEDGGKGVPPCAEGPESNIVTAVQGGHPLKIKLQEFVYHPGHYRIALSVHSRAELPADPDVLAVDGLSVSAAIQDPPQIPVLADGVFRHSEGGGVIDWETDVTLPNISCEKCTLQIIEFMAAHSFNTGGGYYYHHCADLRLTADPNLPPPDLGWTLNPVGAFIPATHYFAQFTSGGGVNSSIVLTNPSTTDTAHGTIGFSDDHGRAQGFSFIGQSSPANAVSFTIKPLGSAAFTTDGSGPVVSGSARVQANTRMASIVKINSPAGGSIAVAESVPLSVALAAVARSVGQGVNTGIAIRNTQPIAVDIALSLRTLDGHEVGGGAATIRVDANGHLAKFIDELFPNASTADFSGTLVARSVSGSSIALTAIETRPMSELTTLPVASIEPVPAATEILFPHITAGSGFVSSLWLLNPSHFAASGNVSFFDDRGSPLSLDLGNQQRNRFSFTLQPESAMTLSTNGQGPLVTGWARADAGDPLGAARLGGSVIFAYPSLGLASMDPSAAGRGFITPVSRSATTRISTGVAIVAKDSDATLTLSLRSKDGEIVPGGQTSLRLPANGHTSRFIEELFPNALTEDFEGAMTITADSNIAAVAFQIGSSAGQFTPLPVAPLQ